MLQLSVYTLESSARAPEDLSSARMKLSSVWGLEGRLPSLTIVGHCSYTPNRQLSQSFFLFGAWNADDPPSLRTVSELLLFRRSIGYTRMRRVAQALNKTQRARTIGLNRVILGFPNSVPAISAPLPEDLPVSSLCGSPTSEQELEGLLIQQRIRLSQRGAAPR